MATGILHLLENAAPSAFDPLQLLWQAAISPHRLYSVQMRAVATDVARSVVMMVLVHRCAPNFLSVGHDRNPCKTADPIEMPFGGQTRVRTVYYMGGSNLSREAALFWRHVLTQ